MMQTIGERFFADPRAQAVDKSLTQGEQEYQAARQATAPRTTQGLITGQEKPGFDTARLVGNIASPASLTLAKVLPAATTTMGRVGLGIEAGGAGGALTPVTEPDAQEHFFRTKAFQTGAGAAAGAVLTPVLGKFTDTLARGVQKLERCSLAARFRQIQTTLSIMPFANQA